MFEQERIIWEKKEVVRLWTIAGKSVTQVEVLFWNVVK